MGIAVGIGTAADQVGAGVQGLDQEFVAAGIIEQAFLRKRADLDIEGPGIIALQPADGAKTFQPDARVNFHMRAHPRGALHDRLFQRATAARDNIVLGKAELRGCDALDRFL